MLVYGTSGAGKTVTLRTLAIAAGAGRTLGATTVYGIDFGSGALRSLEALPHVGTIVTGDDVERIQRLFRTLRDTLDSRAQRFSEVNASTLGEYREITGDHDEPCVLLLLDGFGTFRQEWESGANRVETYATFMRVLGEGRPLGVHIVATADRYGAVPTAVSANITKRVVLRLSDENSYGILGVPRDVLSERSAPGRGIVDGLETQIAVIGGTPNVAEQNAAAIALGERFSRHGVAVAETIGALPVSYPQQNLPDHVGGSPALGIGEHTLGPVAFEPIGTFLVAGPPLSGKSTALRGIVRAMERFDSGTEMYHIGGRRAALAGYRPWKRRASRIEDVRALAKDLTELVSDESETTRVLIVLENLIEYSDTDADRALKELFQAVNRSDQLLIADGDIAQLGSGYGLIGELKASRHGIALRPETFDGDTLFKTPFPKVQRHEFPEGRGIFVEHGRPLTVQLPLAEG
jgi:S-DNA-T family DNA segregation ATPase FtsK/SpoIIIE